MDCEVINLPASKSIALRALALRYSLKTDTRIFINRECRDILEMKNALELLNRKDKEDIDIHISEGGAPFRFILALAASSPGRRVTLNIGKRLAERPVAPLTEALREMGAEILIPRKERLVITGQHLTGSISHIDGSISSQFESALILASPLWRSKVDFPPVDPDSLSAPYRTMTRTMLEIFRQNPADFRVEGDWSAASTFYAASLIRPIKFGTEIRFENLDSPGDSLQGDARIVSLIEDGIRKGRITADMRTTPDIVPALAVGCVVGGLPFRFTGVGNLRVKESDRIEALRNGLMKMGEELIVEDISDNGTEETVISCIPENQIPGKIEISAFGDHRIAMAFAIPELAGWEVRIDNPDVVDKSFPDFWEVWARFRKHVLRTE